MSMNAKILLGVIGYMEPSTFGEVVGGLGADRPEEKGEWRDFFGWVDRLSADGYLEVERVDSKIESLQLTDKGAAFLRDN